MLSVRARSLPHWSQTLRLAAVTNSTYRTNVVSCSGVIFPDSAMPPPTNKDSTCSRHGSCHRHMPNGKLSCSLPTLAKEQVKSPEELPW